MSKRSMPDMKEGGVNVTPLIDIVMCLIIFFMLVAKIGVTRGEDATIIPPSTLLGQKIEDIGNTLTLNVTDPRPLQESTTDPCDRDSSGVDVTRLQPAVTATIKPGEPPRTTQISQYSASTGTVVDYPLRRVLEAIIRGDRAKGIPGNPNLKLIVRADKCLEYRLLQQVLQGAAEAGVTNINFEMKIAKPVAVA